MRILHPWYVASYNSIRMSEIYWQNTPITSENWQIWAIPSKDWLSKWIHPYRERHVRNRLDRSHLDRMSSLKETSSSWTAAFSNLAKSMPSLHVWHHRYILWCHISFHAYSLLYYCCLTKRQLEKFIFERVVLFLRWIKNRITNLFCVLMLEWGSDVLKFSNCFSFRRWSRPSPLVETKGRGLPGWKAAIWRAGLCSRLLFRWSDDGIVVGWAGG